MEDKSVALLIFQASRLWKQLAIERVKVELDSNLKPAHTNLFHYIGGDGIRTTDLAKKLGISKQAVSQLVSDLEKLDVVEYHDDPSDKRAKLIKMTSKGEPHLNQNINILKDMETEFTKRLPKNSVNKIKSGLESLVKVLEESRTNLV